MTHAFFPACAQHLIRIAQLDSKIRYCARCIFVADLRDSTPHMGYTDLCGSIPHMGCTPFQCGQMARCGCFRGTTSDSDRYGSFLISSTNHQKISERTNSRGHGLPLCTVGLSCQYVIKKTKLPKTQILEMKILTKDAGLISCPPERWKNRILVKEIRRV